MWTASVGKGVDLRSLSAEESYRPSATIEEPGGDPVAHTGFDTGELLGRGGMGEVFRARQVALEREVALKKLRPSKAGNPRSRARFLAEAVVTGRLEHPNIVPVYSLLEDGDELSMAMKLIEGEAWKDILRGPQGDDLDLHLGILDKVCNALAFAHSKGIVHCDLKPANVMVGAFGEVLVLDWGLALALGEPPAGGTRLRSAVHLAKPCGTPLYAAPELLAGRGDAVGPWTDVYLLGGLLHELLSKRPPHGGKDLEAVLRSALSDDPPELDAAVPAALKAICRRALRRSPVDRFPDVRSFQAALRGFLAHSESRALALAAWERLEELRAQQREGAPSSLYPLFGECRFGFHHALRVWPENVQARLGLQSCLELMLTYELERGAHAAAATLLDQLPEPNPELAGRVMALGQEQARERAAIEAFKHQQDRQLNVSSRIAFVRAVGILWALLCFASAAGLLPATHASNISVALVFISVQVGCIAFWWKSFRANRFNRRIARSAFFIAFAIVNHRIAAALLGVLPEQAVTQEIGMVFLLFTMMALAIDWRFLPAALVFFLAAAAAVVWTEHAWLWMGLAAAIGTVELGIAPHGVRMLERMARRELARKTAEAGEP